MRGLLFKRNLRTLLDSWLLRQYKGKISEDSSVDLSVGYVTHLCKVGEILETMLLVQHNTNQMENFLDFISNGEKVDFDSISKLIE